MFNAQSKTDVKFSAGLVGNSGLQAKSRVRGEWEVECRDKEGNLKWVENFHNLIVNEGLDHLLDSTLAGQSQIATWYVGLKNTGSAAATDVMNSHGGWTENTTYAEAVRQTWTPNAAASSQSVTNSSSKATFSINGSTTIYGAFLTSNNTKGGTSGKLYAAGDFASSRAVISGDSLLVTATFTTADDGV